MRVSIKDIAEAARVSHSTVSRALSHSPLVKDETKARIKRLAEEIGYSPDAIAHSLVTQKVLTYTIKAKERGLSVIFITHNVGHVYQVADRFAILRRGDLVGTYTKDEVTEQDITDLITGERER